MTQVIQIIIPLFVGLIATAVATGLLIPVLKRQAGQNIREEGPEAHQAKAGTPSMGGIAIVIGVLIAFVCGWHFDLRGMVIPISLLLFGGIGFVDDWLKVIKKQNEGLTPKQKFGLQFLVALIVALYMVFAVNEGTTLYIPFVGRVAELGIWYIPFIVFTLLAMVNAVNLTDGLDGLAAGTTMIVAVVFGVIALAMELASLTTGCIAVAGACAGFLLFNKHPAQIFMGDTGSLALGGVITGAAIAMKMELFLPVMGIIYVLEVLSVCLQVAYFKATHGKRLFKMTPLHHHFELSGMKETHVVWFFWGITAAACLIGIFLGLPSEGLG